MDHYVAKGLTQALPYLSTTNPLLKNVWNGKSIETVSILFHETIDIEGRGQFYDRYGAIKDVIQNHVLQLLAFFALDFTVAKTKKEIAHQKASFLNSLSVQKMSRGQYEGYKAEKDVSSHSTTETYAAITLTSSDPRWKGVTFFLETGKSLSDKRTQLSVQFKPDEKYPANKLVVQFAPREELLLQLNGLKGQPVELKAHDFEYQEAYEAVLQDVFSQQLHYSVSFEEIEAQWRLADAMAVYSSKLTSYPKGKNPAHL